jgi:hypothetical protein
VKKCREQRRVNLSTKDVTSCGVPTSCVHMCVLALLHILACIGNPGPAMKFPANTKDEMQLRVKLATHTGHSSLAYPRA